MGIFDKFKSGLQKTHQKLAHEMRRIVTRSPRMTGSSLEELQAALIAADFGFAMSEEIVDAETMRAAQPPNEAAAVFVPVIAGAVRVTSATML